MAKLIVTVGDRDSESDVFMALLEIGRMHQDKPVGEALIDMLKPHYDAVREEE